MGERGWERKETWEKDNVGGRKGLGKEGNMGNGYTRNEKEMLGMEGDWGLGIMWNGSWEKRETRESDCEEWDSWMGKERIGWERGVCKW